MACSLLRQKFFTMDFSHEYFQPLTFPKLWYLMCVEDPFSQIWLYNYWIFLFPSVGVWSYIGMISVAGIHKHYVCMYAYIIRARGSATVVPETVGKYLIGM